MTLSLIHIYTPYARLVSEQLLRSMAKAQYSDNPLGHYGLALQDYCHFTSPIRRYPDLAIHRILSDQDVYKRQRCSRSPIYCIWHCQAGIDQ